MKTVSNLFLALLAAGLIVACGEKPTEMVEDAAEATTEAVEEAAEATTEAVEEAAEAVAEITTGGGYEPADDEKIEGITMSQEELDAEAARIDAM